MFEPLNQAQPEADSFLALAGLGQAAMDAMPEAVYLCAGDGRVVRFNQKAAELWGRVPRAGDPKERFCGSFRLYRLDGVVLPHEECPVATALRTGQSFHNQEVVIEQPNGRRLTVLVNIAALKDEDGRVTGAVNCFQDITDRKMAEDRQRQMIGELNHRVRNTLTTVRAMLATAADGAASVDDFASRFEARLLALSQAHTLLDEGQWKSAKLRDLLAQQLAPFNSDENPQARLDGPDVDLQPRLALAVSMMFHELTTNAVKHGALSVLGGRIAVEWDLLSNSDDGQTLTLQWRERCGSPVAAPKRMGFGTKLIRSIMNGLDGEADLRFEPSGLQCSMSIFIRNDGA